MVVRNGGQQQQPKRLRNSPTGAEVQRQQDEQASSFKGSPVVGYIRSARRGDPQLDEWEAQIRAYCAERGYNLVEVVRDEGVSAVASWRPGLEKIIQGAERRGWVGVIVPARRHFGRNDATIRMSIGRLNGAGTWVRILDSPGW